MTTRHDIEQQVLKGNWRWLAQVAYAIVQDAEMLGQSEISARLGGGARLMLTANHRLVTDVDIFIHDANWLQLLTPRRNEKFRNFFDSYQEYSNSLKLLHAKGEIDFIVAGTLLPLSTTAEEIYGLTCESVAEVLAKKLFYRTRIITSHDVFDWWSIAHTRPELIPHQDMSRLLKGRLSTLDEVLEKMTSSSFFQTQWNQMLAPEKPSIGEAVEWARSQISMYQRM